MDLILHYHPLSSCCWKVLIALYERGLAFEPRLVNLGDAAARAAYAALWPSAKIPLLQDGARVVPETSIIIEYLEQRHPGAPRLLPPEAGEAQLQARLWDRLFDLYVMDPMQRFIAQRLRPEAERDAGTSAAALATLGMAYALIEERLGDADWAAGADFGLADCAAAPALFYAAIIRPLAPEQPRLLAYFERLMARPSVQRVIAEARPFFRYYPLQDAIPARFLAPPAMRQEAEPVAAGLILSLLAVAALLALLLRQRRAYRAARIQADRLRNILQALSRTNRMIQRLPEERLLWQEACDICVDTGRAVLACIYLREGTLAHRIASAGPAAKMLENVPNPLDLDHPEVQKSYTAQVLREGQRLVSNDYVLDPRAGRWREEAVAQEVRAIAWIPVRRAGAVVATLMLCAGEPDYFDAELLAALDELGEDLSFALDNHDRRREQLAAQQEIEAGRDRFRRLFESAPVPMAIVSIAERRILEANEALCARYGKTRAAMVDTRTASHAYGVLPEDQDVFYATLSTQGRVRNLALRVRDAQGAVHEEVFNADPINYLDMPCCLVSSLDLRQG